MRVRSIKVMQFTSRMHALVLYDIANACMHSCTEKCLCLIASYAPVWSWLTTRVDLLAEHIRDNAVSTTILTILELCASIKEHTSI